MSFCEVFAQVYTAQYGQVKVNVSYFHVKAVSMPPPSLVSFGNFHTLRRSFPTLAQAKKFGSLLRSRFARGPAVQPPAFSWLRSHYKHGYYKEPSTSWEQPTLF